MTNRKLAWRQLLSDPPSSWQRLPLVVRGVGDEILRVLDRDGEIDCGDEHPEDVVLRLCAAHPRERKMVRSAVRQLVADCFLELVEEDGRRALRASLPDIAIAGERSKGRPKGTQTTTHGAFKVGPTPPQGGATDPLPPPLPCTQPERMFSANPSEPLDPGPTEKRREEEKREENTIRARALDGDSGSNEGDSSPLADAERLVRRAEKLLVAGYKRRYEAPRDRGGAGDAWMGAPAAASHILTCARWAVAKGESALEERAEKLLDGVFADEWLTQHRWPWGAVAKDPARFASPAPPAPPAKAKTGFRDVAKDFSGLNQPNIAFGSRKS